MNHRAVNMLTLASVSMIVSISLTACSARPELLRDVATVDECILLPASGIPKDTLAVAVSRAALNTALPVHTDAADRLLYRQLFDNLISVDCNGHTISSISTSWEPLDEGRQWRFHVAPDVPNRGRLLWAVDGSGDVRNPGLRTGSSVDSVRFSDSDVVDIYIRSRSPEPPRTLASPLFPATRRGQGPDSLFRLADYSIIRSLPESTLAYFRPSSGSPILSVLLSSDEDERDLLARGIDLMVTSKPGVIEYARRTMAYASTPLPWETIYVLVSTTRFIEREKVGPHTDASADWWTTFATGAVRADARAPTDGYWWQDLHACLSASDTGTEGVPRPRASFYSSGQRRIRYASDDRVARDIAERLVALSSEDPGNNAATAFFTESIPGLARTGAQISARSATDQELIGSLASGTDFAYVVALDIRPYDRCVDATALFQKAPWLAGTTSDLTISLLPVVETRSHLIYGAQHPELQIDWFGNIRIVPTEASR